MTDTILTLPKLQEKKGVISSFCEFFKGLSWDADPNNGYKEATAEGMAKMEIIAGTDFSAWTKEDFEQNKDLFMIDLVS